MKKLLACDCGRNTVLGFRSSSVGIDGAPHYPGCPRNPFMPNAAYYIGDASETPLWLALFRERPYVRGNHVLPV